MAFLELKPPDIDKFVKTLDRCSIRLNADVGEALGKSAKIIEQEQKRIISQKSHNLSQYIHSKAEKTTKEKQYYRIGYTGEEAVDEWLCGMVLEFGRPGKKNKGYDSLGRRNGRMEEFSHIRRGFDNKVDEADKTVQKAFDNIVDDLEEK